VNARVDHLFSIGAFAIIFDDQQRVLLCHRRDFDLWNLPGGAVEHGELPTEAAIRETREETGLDVIIERLVGVYGKADKDEFVFAFVCSVVGGQLTTTDEADECKYFDIKSIPVNTVPKHVGRIQDALNHDLQPAFRRQTEISTKELLQNISPKKSQRQREG
jgi:8-oxo-dGTP diphosphatase